MTQFIPEDPDTSLSDYIRRFNEEPKVHYHPRVDRRQKYALAVIALLLLVACTLAAFKAITVT